MARHLSLDTNIDFLRQIVEDEEIEAGVTASECFVAALAEAVFAQAGQFFFSRPVLHPRIFCVAYRRAIPRLRKRKVSYD